MALLTLSEAADHLRITLRTLKEHIKHGEIATIVVGRGEHRKKRLIHSDDLDAFVVRQRRTERFSLPDPKPKPGTRAVRSGVQVFDFEALCEERRKAKRSNGRP